MRVIWAIDAFEDNKELNQKMADYAHFLNNKTNAEIIPVYLLRETEINISPYGAPTWIDDHVATAKSLFKEVLQDYHLDFVKDPEVIVHASSSHAGAADALCQYAWSHHADLILVGSHGRQGFQRFILGSFAESLISQSPLPVCIIGHQVTKYKQSRNVLFPTEFGAHSKLNYQFTLNLAKKLQMQIQILHGLVRPIESLFDIETRPSLYHYEGRTLTLDEIVEEEIEIQAQRGSDWTHWAQQEGVQAHARIDSSFKDIDDMILDTVESQNCDLIVMEAQSGPLSAALLGSYTRSVVRRALCPVIILPRHFYDQLRDSDHLVTELLPAENSPEL